MAIKHIDIGGISYDYVKIEGLQESIRIKKVNHFVKDENKTHLLTWFEIYGEYTPKKENESQNKFYRRLLIESRHNNKIT